MSLALAEKPIVDEAEADAGGFLALVPAVPTAKMFSDEEEAKKLYAAIEKIVDEFKPDTSTKTGRDAIKSLAFKVSKVKVAIDKQGLVLTEGWRKDIGLVNASRKKIEDELERLQAKARKPYDDWEAAETIRTAKHQDALNTLLAFIATPAGRSSASLRESLELVENTQIGSDWAEFEDRGAVAKEDAAAALVRLIAAAEKSEADAKELEELRAAKVESDRREAQRVADEQDKQAEAKRAEDARLAEEKRKADLSKAAEDATKKATQDAADALAAAEQRVKDAEAKALKDIEDAKAETERKAEAERKRIADEKAAEAEEQRKRDEDREHRKTVNRSIVDVLIETANVSDEQAMLIVVALAKGQIPNVTLKY